MRVGCRRLFGTWSLIPMLLVAGCSGSAPEDDDTDTPTPTLGPDQTPTVAPNVDPGLTVDDVSLASSPVGGYKLKVTVVGASSQKANLTAKYSLDQLNYRSATVPSNELSNLSVSPEGTTHELTWDAVSDLDYVQKKVYFRLAGKIGDLDLPPAQVTIDVDNRAYDQACVIDLQDPVVQDGDIPLTFTVSDPQGDTCDVTILIEIGSQTAAATASSNDPGDSLVQIAATPDGVSRTFVWDSLTDVKAFDETVIVRAQATDTNNVSEDSVTLDVRNDPVPDAGDVAISEIFFYQDLASYGYVELVNVSRHTLNLRDLALASVSTPQAVISSGTDLLVQPGQIVMVATASVPLTDTVQPDAIVSGLTMSRTAAETVKLIRTDGPTPVSIDEVAYSVADLGGKDVVRGHALALGWDYLSTSANDSLANWCLEDEKIPSTEADYDYGSPKAPTHCVPVGVPSTRQ